MYLNLNRILLTIAVILSFIGGGCVPLLIGVGVLTGYTLSNDSATGNVKVTYRELWDISRKVLDKIEDAEILESNESKGIIKVKISDIDLTIRIDSVGENEQRLRVCARKYLLPKPQYAQKIFFKIIRELE
ncbi:MAG: hypothetical protein J7K71_02860 [Candidatus Omnitrophica bacterium]|nr:hypothetical protein [Candidatus Omnitrophota bacterium]